MAVVIAADADFDSVSLGVTLATDCASFAERHQLSLVGRQRHGVHALGRRRRRWRHCGARVRVHGRQRRMAQGGLRDAAAWRPVSRPSTKSVVSCWLLLACKGFTMRLSLSCLSLCAGSKLFRSETVCPPTTVKFERGCYHFEPVVYTRTFKESREHCRLIGWYTAHNHSLTLVTKNAGKIKVKQMHSCSLHLIAANWIFIISRLLIVFYFWLYSWTFISLVNKQQQALRFVPWSYIIKKKNHGR